MPDLKSTPDDVEALFALEDLEIEEVSLVDRGDNPGAQILMVKNASDRDTDAEAAKGASVGKGMIRERMKAEEMYRHKSVFADMLVSLLDAEYEDESEFTDQLEGLVGEYAEIVRGYGMRDLSKEIVDAVALSNGERTDLIAAVKRAAGLSDDAEKQKDSGAVGVPNKTAANLAAKEAQMAEKVNASAVDADAEKKAPAVDAAPVEDLAKERDDFAKAAAAAQERAVELEKRLAAVEKRDALRSEIAKISKEFQHVGGASAEDLAKAMILIREKAPDAVETLESILKAAEEAGKDAFSGRAVEGEPRPENKVEAYRAEVGKLKQERGLTHEQAMIALRKERPELHAAAFGGGQ